MKHYNCFLLSIAFVSFVSSCVEENDMQDNDFIKSFKCVPWAYSRMNDDVNQWNKDDQVGMFKFPKNDVTAPAELSSNVLFTAASEGSNVEFVSSIGVPTSPLASDFVAYYPYSDDANDLNLQFDLSDQTSGYAKYDLMWGQNKNIVNRLSKDMTFTFKHQFAKLDITPSIREGQVIDEVILSGTTNNVEFNIPTGVITDKGNGNIKFYKSANGNYVALIPPAASATSLVLNFSTSGVDGDKDYTYSLTEGKVSKIESAKEYRLAIELGDYVYGTIDEVEAGSSPYEDVEIDDYTGIKPVEFAAFPGAYGHGRVTVGGRGGKVYHVTSLDDDNPNSPKKGTLRWAINQVGPRTIVFDVAGTIHLQGELAIRNDYITIAGQTSPGGICVADHAFTIKADEVIIRYMRFRPGGKNVDEEPDGLGGFDNKNVIVDHCTASWSVDECLSIYGTENSTVQWCMAYQALRDAGHSSGTHGFGGNWGGYKASYHHNIIAHCESRVPRLGPRYTTQNNEYVDIRNNVFYNWSKLGCYGGENQNVNIVSNYYKPGPATTGAVRYRIALIGVRTTEYCTEDDGSWNVWQPSWHKWGKFYITGNVTSDNPEVSADNWPNGVYAQQKSDENVDYLWTQETMDTIRVNQPVIDAAGVPERSAEDAYRAVLKYAGASNYRDVLDKLIISDIEKGEATCTADGNEPGFINRETDVLSVLPELGDNPYPELKRDETIDVTDTDGDGMPDVFEKEYGLNPNNADDGNAKTLDPDHNYTNLEIYLHLLVEKITTAQYN